LANINAVLFFDQPSQAHYPAEQDRNGDIEVLPDEDRGFTLIAGVVDPGALSFRFTEPSGSGTVQHHRERSRSSLPISGMPFARARAGYS
jgi:hypothetical protein